MNFAKQYRRTGIDGNYTQAASSGTKKPEFGLIILGNAGSGKSFICNLIVDSDRFEADFRPEAVTTKTEHHRLDMGHFDLLVYNIPGLVEVNQEQIDRNKREIMRAFEECPISTVMFVWTQVGGRAQSDDVIAFKALNSAYEFPPGSLAFVVNNLPPQRPPQYEGQFLATLANALKPLSMPIKDTIFLDALNLKDKAKTADARFKLLHLISKHHATEQYKRRDITLDADRLVELRDALKQQMKRTEQDRATFERQKAEMAAQYEKEKRVREQEQRKLIRDLEQQRDDDRRYYEQKNKETVQTLKSQYDADLHRYEKQHQESLEKLKQEREEDRRLSEMRQQQAIAELKMKADAENKKIRKMARRKEKKREEREEKLREEFEEKLTEELEEKIREEREAGYLELEREKNRHCQEIKDMDMRFKSSIQTLEGKLNAAQTTPRTTNSDLGVSPLAYIPGVNIVYGVGKLFSWW